MTSDEDGGALETVRFLARADSRVHVMDHLADAGPADQRELRTELDASRTTVARALRSLEKRGWVANGDGRYRLTGTGSVVARAFEDVLDTIRATEDIAAFLRWFPRELSAPDFVAPSDIAVTTSSDGDPYAPARRQSEILTSADGLRILLPSIDLEGTKVVTGEVTAGNLEAETVVSPGIEPTISADEFAPLFREMVATGRSDVYVASSDVPIYLGLADDGRVQVGVEDDEGFPRALLETRDDTIREWAESVYQKYRADVRQKPAAEFG